MFQTYNHDLVFRILGCAATISGTFLLPAQHVRGISSAGGPVFQLFQVAGEVPGTTGRAGPHSEAVRAITSAAQLLQPRRDRTLKRALQGDTRTLKIGRLSDTQHYLSNWFVGCSRMASVRALPKTLSALTGLKINPFGMYVLLASSHGSTSRIGRPMKQSLTLRVDPELLAAARRCARAEIGPDELCRDGAQAAHVGARPIRGRSKASITRNPRKGRFQSAVPPLGQCVTMNSRKH